MTVNANKKSPDNSLKTLMLLAGKLQPKIDRLCPVKITVGQIETFLFVCSTENIDQEITDLIAYSFKSLTLRQPIQIRLIHTSLPNRI